MTISTHVHKINLHIYPTWLNWRIARKLATYYSLFLGVPTGAFLEEINIWTGKVSKGNHPNLCGWAPRSLLRAKLRRRQRNGKFSLSLGWDIVSSCLLTSELQVLKTLENYSLINSLLLLISLFLRPQTSDRDSCHWPQANLVPGHLDSDQIIPRAWMAFLPIITGLLGQDNQMSKFLC